MARLEVVCGPMFAGKSSYLSGRYLRAERQRKRIAVVTHSVDRRARQRHDEGFYPDPVRCATWADVRSVVERQEDPTEWDGIPVVRRADLLLLDEVQFMPEPTQDELQSILSLVPETVAFGLDLDADGRPWATTASLLAQADKVTKLTAVCECGADATRTQRLRPTTSRVAVGGEDLYRAACVGCWYPQ